MALSFGRWNDLILEEYTKGVVRFHGQRLFLGIDFWKLEVMGFENIGENIGHCRRLNRRGFVGGIGLGRGLGL